MKTCQGFFSLTQRKTAGAEAQPQRLEPAYRKRTAQGMQRDCEEGSNGRRQAPFRSFLRFCRRHSISVVASSASKGNQMAAERFYIYRCGRTDSCAVTATKNEARLLRSLCPTSWQFWMQITRYQFEDSRSGFTFDAAIAGIKAKGYFLFTGPPELLGKVVPAPGSEGSPNVS
jgi:hypothetical protein